MNHRLGILLFLCGLLAACGGGTAPERGGSDSTGDTAVPPRRVELDPEPDFESIAESYENPDRENWQKPDVLIARLGNLGETVVADIGAGTGYFTFRLSEKAKKVIAIDIDSRFLDYIDKKQKRARSQGISNIETRLTGPDDPALGKGEATIVLTVNTYHLIENRAQYFSKVKQALAAGGKLVVVDYKKEKIPVGPGDELKLAPEEVVKELREAGFTELNIDLKTLPYQYIVFAE